MKAPEYGALQITALILTYNEAPNIGRTLERLKWAKEILVVDSFSTDETLDIVRTFPQTRILQRKFDTFADQCNYGLEQVRTDWVLSLDADYILSLELIQEIQNSIPNPSSPIPNPSSSICAVVAFRVGFRYCIHGHRLRASLYPPRTVLYRKGHAHYNNDGHGHRVEIKGSVGTLRGWIDHDDRKSLDRWLQEQSRYARIEADHLLNTPSAELNFADRLRRKVILAPFLVFFYTLIGKRLIFDGWRGFYYVAQRTVAELLLSLKLIEKKIARR